MKASDNVWRMVKGEDFYHDAKTVGGLEKVSSPTITERRWCRLPFFRSETASARPRPSRVQLGAVSSLDRSSCLRWNARDEGRPETKCFSRPSAQDQGVDRGASSRLTETGQ